MDRAERSSTPLVKPRAPEPRDSRKVPMTQPPLGEPEKPGFRIGSWAPLLVVLLAMWGYQAYGSRSAAKDPPIAYSELYALVADGKVDKLTLTGKHVEGHLRAPETLDGKSRQTFVTTLPDQDDRELLPLLREKKVDVRVASEETSVFTQLAITFLPWILILGGWLWLSRRMQRSMPQGGPLASMLKGRSKRFEVKEELRVRFDDVAGLRGAKQDLEEIVDFLKNPEHFRKLGGKVPRGVLLVGPPGTGKTLIARAVAGEAGVPFFSISGSEFIELFVGVGASRVRELFEEARKASPAIVFIDEIDAVGRTRGTGLGGGNDEREQTLNQLLSEMDGFSRTDLTVVIAATNRPDVLDPALMRPGRFDRRIFVDRPESAARKSILEVHTREKPIGADVSLDDLARNTPGFSGADLANLVNEAALTATRRRADAIEARDFADAYDKVLLGDAREGRLLPDEKHRVAIHESGHAIVAHFTEHADPLHRVSILPRGMALGVTMQTPGDDKHIATQPELEAKLRVLMGGYAAESELLGSVSSGSENDLKKATEIAYKMVAHYGMSPAIGPVFHDHHQEHPFLGAMVASEGGVSDQTVHSIEEEARKLLAEALEDARRRVREHRDAFQRLVDALLEKESVERVALFAMLGEPGLPAKLEVSPAE